VVRRARARDRIERSGLGTPIDLVYLDLGGTTVELISYEGVAVEPAPQNEHLGYRMIALEVDHMQKTADYLKTKGVDIVWGPRFRETYARAEICDPGGNHIELRQWFRAPDPCRFFRQQHQHRPVERPAHVFNRVVPGFWGQPRSICCVYRVRGTSRAEKV
jgi:hypothetical protein